MNKRRQAEAEIVEEAVDKLDGRATKDDDINKIRRKIDRASKLGTASPLRIGRKFLKETDPNKH